jgi:hypothetical protein
MYFPKQRYCFKIKLSNRPKSCIVLSNVQDVPVEIITDHVGDFLLFVHTGLFAWVTPVF